jgi:hypothetical protein
MHVLAPSTVPLLTEDYIALLPLWQQFVTSSLDIDQLVSRVVVTNTRARIALLVLKERVKLTSLISSLILAQLFTAPLSSDSKTVYCLVNCSGCSKCFGCLLLSECK